MAQRPHFEAIAEQQDALVRLVAGWDEAVGDVPVLRTMPSYRPSVLWYTATGRHPGEVPKEAGPCGGVPWCVPIRGVAVFGVDAAEDAPPGAATWWLDARQPDPSPGCEVVWRGKTARVVACPEGP